MKVVLKTYWIQFISIVAVLIVLIVESKGRNDFDIFISASKDLMLGKNIYAISYNDWYHYYYDVLFALLLSPFNSLPIFFVKLIWLCGNVFFVFRIWKIIYNWLPINHWSSSQKHIFTLLSFVFVLSFLRDNFHLAQLTIFILYLILEGLNLISNDKIIAGSALIALGINIKLLPLFILPYLIYRNQWKAFFYIVLFCAIGLLLPALFIGYHYNIFLLIERWHLINPTNQQHILDTSERSFHSLTTLLTTLLIKDCGDTFALPIKRNIADISIENLSIAINCCRCFFIFFTLYFLQKPFTTSVTKIQRLYEVSYICIIIPLLFPHQQFYAFLFIFPATTYLLFFLFNNYFLQKNKSKNKKALLIAALAIIYFLTNSHFILGVFNDYYQHFKTLTYGVLMLIIVLAFCHPNKLMKQSEG